MSGPLRAKGLLLLAICAALSAGARAGDFAPASAGTTGSEFLLLDVGARGIGMGGAYTALTNDSYSLYWNPAGLTRVPRVSASFMYSKYLVDTSYQSMSYAQRVNDTSVIAAGWRYQDLGQINRTDISDTDIGTFHPRSHVLELGWGQSIYDLSDSEVDLTVGVTARWIHSDIILKAEGYGGDIGVQSRFYRGAQHYDLALTVQNMGMGQNFVRTRDTLPLRGRVGAAAYPVKNLTVSLEGIMSISNSPYGAVGAEYVLPVSKAMKLAMRAGFNSLSIDALGPFSTMTMGMGLAVGDFSVDYAFVPYGVLGTAQVHRMSFSFNLPSKVSRRYRER